MRDLTKLTQEELMKLYVKFAKSRNYKQLALVEHEQERRAS